MKALRCLLLLLFASPRIEAAGFIDHLEGVPYTWQSFPITYLVDDEVQPASALETLVSDAFATWSASSIASVSFSNGGLIDGGGTDIVGSNVENFVIIDPTTGAPENQMNDTVIIVDSDGTVLDTLLGNGASTFVLGLASPGKFDDATNAIVAGMAIMNNKSTSGPTLRATMTHEFGHLLNLAHTQLSAREAFDEDSSNDVNIPTMFHVLPSDPTQILTLNVDDEFSLAMLYPNDAAFNARGKITGTVKRRNGDPLRAVNVVCRSETSGRLNSVSWLTDVYLQDTGEFVCGNLSSGLHIVEIEPVFAPINIFDPDPPFIASEYYSGSNESFDPMVDVRSESSTVSVTAGATTEEVDFIVNEDGRLISGETVSGRTNGLFTQLAYLITVPQDSRSAEFRVSWSGDVDIDVLGRCDGEFSLPIDSTAAPLTAALGDQQADFASVSTTTNPEVITLDATTSPQLQNCTYHVLVVNYDFATEDTVDFELTVTIDREKPILRVLEGKGVVSGGTGEIPVMSRILIAEGDTFRLKGLTVTDEGDGALGALTTARLYRDVDESGTVTNEDRLLAETTDIDTSARNVTFTGMDEFIDEGARAYLLVSYEVSGSSSAGSTFWIAIALLGMILGISRARHLEWKALSILLLTVTFLTSCGGTQKGFHPNIAKGSDVNVVGQTFGTHIQVLGPVKSVKDFFN